MINELTDKEILEFLMTSDFQDSLSPDEFRFLLLKFRNYYRVSASRNDLLNSEIDMMKRNTQLIETLNQRILELSNENSNLSDKISKIMNKKLSIKERIFGKILNNK